MRVLPEPWPPGSASDAVSADAADRAAVASTASRLDARLVALIVAMLAVLALYGQPYWPATWLDEGFVTNGAKTLVTRGRYATTSADHLRIVDPTLVANGPGVLIPVAVAMRIAGPGLWPARATAAIFLVVCGVLVAVFAARLGGTGAALIALLVVVTIPREGFLYLGRMAMGNVPALAYLIGGLLLWHTAVDRGGWWRGLAAGSLFGVAAVTKAQWSMVLPPALALAWLVHHVVMGRRDHRIFLGAAAGTVMPLLLWYGARVLLQGPAVFATDLAELSETSQWTVLALHPLRYLAGSLWYVLRSGIGAVWLCGVGFAVWVVLTRPAEAPRVVLPAALATVWMTWYLLASIGWQRYAFEALVVSALLAGPALARWREIGRSLAATPWRRPLRVPAAALGVVLLVFVARHAVERTRDLTGDPDRSAQIFVRAVEQVVGQDELVESWEWQLGVLTDRRVHHPDDAWVGKYTAQIFADVPVREHYAWRAQAPRYVIDGPFSKFTGIYHPDLASGCCTLVTSEGGYDLYRVNDAAE